MDVVICLFVMKRLVVITNFRMVLEIWEKKRFFFFFSSRAIPVGQSLRHVSLPSFIWWLLKNQLLTYYKKVAPHVFLRNRAWCPC